MQIPDFLEIYESGDGEYRVKSRERRDLEFKENISDNTLRASLKTVAAFANSGGGRIVFGVTDSPRTVKGVDADEVADEARLCDFFQRYLYPIPSFSVEEFEVGGVKLVCIQVQAVSKPPVLAIKECQTKEKKNKTVLSPGVIYARRAGQTDTASSEEFRAMLDRRDQRVQDTIFGLFDRARDVGFENISVADFSDFAKPKDNVTLYLPEEAAKSLNVIDKARVVKDNGAPAYVIQGNINFTSYSDKDPRKPMLPAAAARALRAVVEAATWKSIPWSPNHLRKVAHHLGFWDKQEGDGIHTAIEELTKKPRYLERGRIAIAEFVRKNTDEFVQVVCSRENKSEWTRRKKEQQRQQVPELQGDNAVAPVQVEVA